MSAVGIFGGTFDPPHLGHLIIAQAVREIRNLDKIIFVPSYISPHKKNISTSDKSHRLNMIKLGINDYPYFDFSEIELKKKSVSYTIDTLRELKKIHDKLELIIGLDNIVNFKTWKDPDEIIKIAKLIVIKRKTNKETDSKDKYFKSAIFVDTPIIEITGTEIRRRVREGLPINFLVPDKVMEYIYNFNLYKE